MVMYIKVWYLIFFCQVSLIITVVYDLYSQVWHTMARLWRALKSFLYCTSDLECTFKVKLFKMGMYKSYECLNFQMKPNDLSAILEIYSEFFALATANSSNCYCLVWCWISWFVNFAVMSTKLIKEEWASLFILQNSEYPLGNFSSWNSFHISLLSKWDKFPTF